MFIVSARLTCEGCSLAGSGQQMVFLFFFWEQNQNVSFKKIGQEQWFSAKISKNNNLLKIKREFKKNYLIRLFLQHHINVMIVL